MPLAVGEDQHSAAPKSNALGFRMNCPHCHFALGSRPELAGMTFACPQCDGVFTVPAPLAVPPFQPSRAAHSTPRRKASSRGFYWLVLLVIASGAAATVVVFYPSRLPQIANAMNPENDQEMIARVFKSVVTVRTKDGFGSGFFVIDNQTVVTNYHVVEKATQVTVEYSDGTKIEAVGFAAVIPEDDIVILKLRRSIGTAAPLSLAEAVPSQGTRVFAFGAPSGMQNSVSDGIVSAVRTVQQLNESLGGTPLDLRSACRVIQITAPISPGSSGGPLTSEDGEVIGVNSASYAGRRSQSLNFAVGRESVATAIRQLGPPRPFRELPPPYVPPFDRKKAP